MRIKKLDIREIQKIINNERRRRGLRYVEWSKEMAHLAYDQAKCCKEIGYLEHSNRYALCGGENLLFIPNQMATPKKAVGVWMGSSSGHREWLLSPEVKSAGVGIFKGKYKGSYGFYVAWAFTSEHKKGYYIGIMKKFLGIKNGSSKRKRSHRKPKAVRNH